MFEKKIRWRVSTKGERTEKERRNNIQRLQGTRKGRGREVGTGAKSAGALRTSDDSPVYFPCRSGLLKECGEEKKFVRSFTSARHGRPANILRAF